MDRAIELYRKTYPGGSLDTFSFTRLPYYVNPDALSEGVPMLDKMAQKNGEERVNAIKTRLERVGRAHGISFNFGGRTGSTRDSHRLIAFARSKGGLEQQKLLIEQIFESHFEREGDIISRDMLTRAAVAAGLLESEVKDFLQSDGGKEELDMLALKSRQSGVASVPTVDINGVRVEGAEDASEFYQAFIEARQNGSI